MAHKFYMPLKHALQSRLTVLSAGIDAPGVSYVIYWGPPKTTVPLRGNIALA